MIRTSPTTFAGSLLFVLLALSGCATESGTDRSGTPEALAAVPDGVNEEPAETAPPSGQDAVITSSPAASLLEERWGIRIVSLRTSAGGYMLDFRYRVLDPEKAKPLFERAAKPYAIDGATGAKLLVPSPPKIGSLRSTGIPQAERNYCILFANPGQLVKKGGKASLVVGDFRVDDVTVQ